jgi:hypothetical protein
MKHLTSNPYQAFVTYFKFGEKATKLINYSERLAQSRTRFAGHCFRAKDEIISDLIMWKASNSRKLAFPDTFLETVVSQ